MTSKHDNPIISRLTRKQAIEMGALDDFTEPDTRDVVSSMGFPYPIAITYAASVEASDCSHELHPTGVFAVLRALRVVIHDSNATNKIYFEVPHRDTRQPPIAFKSVSELGDDGSPVLTITTMSESDTLNS